MLTISAGDTLARLSSVRKNNRSAWIPYSQRVYSRGLKPSTHISNQTNSTASFSLVLVSRVCVAAQFSLVELGLICVGQALSSLVCMSTPAQGVWKHNTRSLASSTALSQSPMYSQGRESAGLLPHVHQHLLCFVTI